MIFSLPKLLVTQTIFTAFGLCCLLTPVDAEVTLERSGRLRPRAPDLIVPPQVIPLPFVSCAAATLSGQRDRSVDLLNAILIEERRKALSAFTPVDNQISIQDCGAFFALSILRTSNTVVRHLRVLIAREDYLEYLAGQPEVHLRFKPELLRERYQFLLIGF